MTRPAVAPAAQHPHAAVAQRLAAPAALAADQCRSLLDSLAQLADPRQRRSRRHPLGAVLAVAVAAVLAGAGSWRKSASGRWTRPGRSWPPWGAPPPVDGRLALTRRGDRAPRAGLRDPDALDRATGAWLASQQPPTRPPPAPHPRRAVAVDGKTLPGSGHHPKSPVHLLATMDHTSRAVLAQADVEATTNEIARFRPLLEGMDLADTVVTADALHTQREHADWLVTAKRAAYL
jgi:hypothetical protein